jgi:catechol 2,3-dioxygenase-like lactoylglutathione lyase family enzyme
VLEERPTAAKIRHIAIATQDPNKIAAFFKEVLGLQQVRVANEVRIGLSEKGWLTLTM